MERLEPFKEKNGTLKEGEFNYYSFTFSKTENFTIFLNVNSGSMKSVLNKGFGNLPTIKNYWKKISTLKGGEIVVLKN